MKALGFMISLLVLASCESKKQKLEKEMSDTTEQIIQTNKYLMWLENESQHEKNIGLSEEMRISKRKIDSVIVVHDSLIKREETLKEELSKL